MNTLTVVDDGSLFTGLLIESLKQKFEKVKGIPLEKAFENLLCMKNDLTLVNLSFHSKTTIEKITSTKPNSLVGISEFTSPNFIHLAEKKGFNKILSKQLNIDEIHHNLYSFLENKHSIRTKTDKETLSFREIDIISLCAQGKVASEIANELYISEGTVKTHLRNVIQKYECRNMKEVIARFQSEGLFLFSAC